MKTVYATVRIAVYVDLGGTPEGERDEAVRDAVLDSIETDGLDLDMVEWTTEAEALADRRSA